MDKLVIDLSDPNVATAARIAIMCYGVAILIVIYNIGSDLVGLLRTGKKKAAKPERRFIEPCADGMHLYEDGACSTCKAEEPPPSE